MSKIIQAMKKMIENRHEIGEIGMHGTNGEYNRLFFTYRKQYKWLIAYSPETNDYTLCYFSGNEPIHIIESKFSREFGSGPENDDFRYSTALYSSEKEKDTFHSLFKVVKERYFDLDGILDEIIEDSPAKGP